jgi:hypothetical protein
LSAYGIRGLTTTKETINRLDVDTQQAVPIQIGPLHFVVEMVLLPHQLQRALYYRRRRTLDEADRKNAIGLEGAGLVHEDE